MKLVSFTVGDRTTFGIVTGEDGLIDLGARLGDRCSSLGDLIKNERFEALVAEHQVADADFRFADVRFLPPFVPQQTIISAGALFPEHIQENVDAGLLKGPLPYPAFHIKSASSMVGHRENIVNPRVSEYLDWEIEFAIIIGKPCHHVAPDRVFEHVLGYSILNDGSVRDYQAKHSPGAGKNFGKSGSFGPWIITKDEVGDIAPLFVTTRLNGKVMQRERIGTLVTPMAEVISYLSDIFYLQPGDVITTGSAGGVGYFHKPQRFLRAGDELEFEVDKVGILKNTVVDES